MKLMSLLFAGARWKTTLMVGGAAILIAGSAYYYVQNLRSTVEDLRQTNEVVQRDNRELRLQMDENLEVYQRDMKAMNRVFEEYNKAVVANEINYQNTVREFDAIDDEELRACLNTRLPDELINRLFDTDR